MVAQSNARPIVKRRKIVKASGHHGGAWKVAYADFVTAMMAFFMMMWLLGATTEKQRKGIADYFNPTVPINRISGGGEGAFGGDSVFSEDTMAQSGSGAGMVRPTEENRARGNLGPGDAETDAALLRDVESAVVAYTGDSVLSELLRRHVVTRLSEEALVIELFDTEDTPLYEDESGRPSVALRALAPAIAEALSIVRNDVAIEAHLRSAPGGEGDPSSAWARSSARAVSLRALLIEAGHPEARIRRVTGYADRQPVTIDPTFVRNNRVEIVVLRSR